MATAFNPIDSMDRLHQSGFSGPQAKALAQEIIRGIDDRVTKADLDAALAKQALFIIGVIGSIVIGAVAVLGLILSN